MKILKIFVLLILAYSAAFSQNNITGYEFWLDGDYQNKTASALTPAEEITLEEGLDLSDAAPGFHFFNIRFSDSEGNWSSAVSQLIFKMGNDGGDENEIVEYEFWADDYDYVKNGQVTQDREIILDDLLDLSDFQNGFHTFNIRFKDSGGLWSGVISSIFFKMGNSDNEENLVKAYRWWFDNDFDIAEEVELPQPVEQSEVNILIEIPSENTESFSIQFQDVGNLWSSVHTRLFVPEADFDVYSVVNTFTFMNKSTFGEEFEWDFGDGSPAATTKNPSYDYLEPGVYDVRLIAKNKLGSDTAYKTIGVNGLREVHSNKAGNNGYATVLIYGGGLKDGSKVWLEKDGTKYLDADNVRLARLSV